MRVRADRRPTGRAAAGQRSDRDGGPAGVGGRHRGDRAADSACPPAADVDAVRRARGAVGREARVRSLRSPARPRLRQHEAHPGAGDLLHPLAGSDPARLARAEAADGDSVHRRRGAGRHLQRRHRLGPLLDQRDDDDAHAGGVCGALVGVVLPAAAATPARQRPQPRVDGPFARPGRGVRGARLPRSEPLRGGDRRGARPAGRRADGRRPHRLLACRHAGQHVRLANDRRRADRPAHLRTARHAAGLPEGPDVLQLHPVPAVERRRPVAAEVAAAG